MRKTLLLVSVFLPALAYGCAAEPLFLPEEADIVATILAEDHRLSEFKTYVLPDELVELCLQPSGGNPSYEAFGGAGGAASLDPVNCREVTHSLDAAILEAIEEGMASWGYDRLPESESDSADLVLLAGLISRSTWSLDVAYCYPPSYYSGCVEPLSNEPVILPHGALLLQLVDLEASSESKLSSTWTAAIHQHERIQQTLGSSSGDSGVVTAGAIMSDAISQAFSQSPYLGEGE